MQVVRQELNGRARARHGEDLGSICDRLSMRSKLQVKYAIATAENADQKTLGPRAEKLVLNLEEAMTLPRQLINVA